MSRTARTAAGVAILIATLAACKGDDLKPVEGARDDLRYVAPVYRMETKQVNTYTTRCTTSKGSTTCKQVKTGTRSETHNVLQRAERWCVELDNVNGDPRADDLWYTVDQGTHQLASETVEGKLIKFTPLAEGC